MDRIFFDIKHGIKTISADERVKVCFVRRYNRFTGKERRIKLLYVEVDSLQELDSFCSSKSLDFVLEAHPLAIDAEKFDCFLVVTRQKKVKNFVEVGKHE